MTIPAPHSLQPHSSRANADRYAFLRALKLFRAAARRVPAYRDFLRKARVKPERIQTKKDFAIVPFTDKENYFTQYSLAELSWDGVLPSHSKYISTSSGSTGVPFFWPRGGVQDNTVGLIFQNLYENIFDTKKGNTLFVNSFGLGTWIAGFEYYNATGWAADRGNNIVIVTPSIDKHEAINQIKKLAPFFERIILSGYPPFIKDIVAEGADAGIQWENIDVRLFLGGEPISELWRKKVMEMLKNKHLATIINLYGMAESGTVAHETPFSIFLAQHWSRVADICDSVPHADDISGMYQYYPNARYFEELSDNSLLLTSNAGLPLIRYNTRDTGAIIDSAKLRPVRKKLTREARTFGVHMHAWQLPVICLYGRKDLSILFYALNIYVENVKHALEVSSDAHAFSGLFTMSVEYTKEYDQEFKISIELGRDAVVRGTSRRRIAREITDALRKVNSEYARLYASIGSRAMPTVTLIPYGKMQTVPGRKHKWVKK